MIVIEPYTGRLLCILAAFELEDDSAVGLARRLSAKLHLATATCILWEDLGREHYDILAS